MFYGQERMRQERMRQERNETTDSLLLRGGKTAFLRGEDEVDSSGRIYSERIAIEGQDVYIVWDAD